MPQKRAPAGSPAAVYAARAMLEPGLIQGSEPGGQLTITTEVENWPGIIETQGPELMEQMEAHARAVGTEVIADHVMKLDLSRRPFVAECDPGTIWPADAVIMATGAQARWLGRPAGAAYKGFRVSACPPRAGLFSAASAGLDRPAGRCPGWGERPPLRAPRANRAAGGNGQAKSPRQSLCVSSLSSSANAATSSRTLASAFASMSR